MTAGCWTQRGGVCAFCAFCTFFLSGVRALSEELVEVRTPSPCDETRVDRYSFTVYGEELHVSELAHPESDLSKFDSGW